MLSAHRIGVADPEPKHDQTYPYRDEEIAGEHAHHIVQGIHLAHEPGDPQSPPGKRRHHFAPLPFLNLARTLPKNVVLLRVSKPWSCCMPSMTSFRDQVILALMTDATMAVAK